MDQYISDFYNSICIKKAMKRAFEWRMCIARDSVYTLEHQSPISVDIYGGNKTNGLRSTLQKYEIIILYGFPFDFPFE